MSDLHQMNVTEKTLTFAARYPGKKYLSSVYENTWRISCLWNHNIWTGILHLKKLNVKGIICDLTGIGQTKKIRFSVLLDEALFVLTRLPSHPLIRSKLFCIHTDFFFFFFFFLIFRKVKFPEDYVIFPNFRNSGNFRKSYISGSLVQLSFKKCK